jgi:RHH-type proline utilization regulon transcriptional repressor/proline dehydrogenase/delta 1-pyrroline-5-carboxylate dehydrogenase
MGPVIDCGAVSELHDHIERMIEEATLIAKIELGPHCKNGSFVAAHVFELQSINQLHDEVFGPILHVIRYSAKNLSEVINQINETGYGLTLGIHSRIEAFAETVFRNTIAGNTYINRNTVGAVVGVNPFGGRGLSGTGPKAGGPNYLYQFSNASTIGDQSSKNFDFNHNSKPLCSQLSDSVERAKPAMIKWASTSIQERVDMVLKVVEAITETSLETLVKDKLSHPLHLPGPTGESNQLSLHGRGVMLLIIRDEDPRMAITLQIASALLCGCSLLICVDKNHDEIVIDVLKRYEVLGLPTGMLQTVALNIAASLIQHPDIAGVIANSFGANSSALRQEMAKRSGCIIPLIEWPKINADYNYRWLLGFLSERTRTENLVARGGNTQLFNLAN